MGKTKRVGLYLRVSTDDQTVENQRLDLQRVAEQRGWQVIETYVDQGISGAKGRDARPAFDRLCNDAARGKINLIAAWALDRIGRSQRDVINFITDLPTQGVELYLHKEQIDSSSPIGKAALSILAAFAELELSRIRERVKAGLRRAKAQGKRLGRPRSITPDIESKIRALRAKKRGIHAIAKELKVGVGTVQRVIAA